MAATSSFQLQIAHRLKHWIVDFLSFEMVYSLHHLDFRKYSKSGCYDCHQEYASRQILFTFSPCIPDLLLANDFQALPKIPHNSPQSWLALVIKLQNKNTKTCTKWLKSLSRVLNMPIELKGLNYYSKVFKRINYRLSNSTFWVVIMKMLT